VTVASLSTAADLASGIVDPYLRIQMALADDSMAPVKADAARIAAEAARLGDSAKALQAAATELQSTADIAAARAAFGRLSDALIKYARHDARDPRPGCQRRLLPDGEEVLGAEGHDDLESVRRQEDAAVR